MNYSPFDADDAFQAIRRAERWKAAAVAATETTVDPIPAGPGRRDGRRAGDGARRTILQRLQRSGARYG
jgi:hypothetical protein